MTRLMRRTSSAVCLLLFALFACQLHGLEKAKMIELFNGKDLSGWLAKGGAADETLKVGTAKLDPSNPQELVVEASGDELINFKGHAEDSKAQPWSAGDQPDARESGILERGEVTKPQTEQSQD